MYRSTIRTTEPCSNVILTVYAVSGANIMLRFWLNLVFTGSDDAPPQLHGYISCVHQVLEELLTSQKNVNRHLESKKNVNLTVDLLSLDIYYAPGPEVLTYRSQILRGLESELRPGFRPETES